MSIQITVTGNVGNNPTFTNVSRKDGSTVPVCNFSLASSDFRRVTDDANNVSFEQIGETAWLDCRFWGDKAESLTKLLQKGMPLIVSGSEQIRKSEKDGTTYVNRVLNVEHIGLNLLSPRVEEIKLRPAKEGAAPDTASTASESDIPF